jgi:hypothetical protein
MDLKLSNDESRCDGAELLTALRDLEARSKHACNAIIDGYAWGA